MEGLSAKRAPTDVGSPLLVPIICSHTGVKIERTNQYTKWLWPVTLAQGDHTGVTNSFSCPPSGRMNLLGGLSGRGQVISSNWYTTQFGSLPESSVVVACLRDMNETRSRNGKMRG